MADDSNLGTNVVKEISSLTRDFGRFLADVFGPSFRDIGDIAHFQTHQWRIKNAIKFKERMERLAKERGITSDDIANFRVGIPLIEAALNEDDNDLQEMWASLLTSERKTGIKRSHISTLQNLDPIDAQTLQVIVSLCGRSLSSEQRIWIKSGKTSDDVIETWHSIKHLEFLGIINRKQTSSDEIKRGEFRLICGTIVEDSKKLNVMCECRIELTMLGYEFLTAAYGKAPFSTNEGSIIVLDWDEFKSNIKSP